MRSLYYLLPLSVTMLLFQNEKLNNIFSWLGVGQKHQGRQGSSGSLTFLIAFVAPFEFLKLWEASNPLMIIKDADEGKNSQ